MLDTRRSVSIVEIAVYLPALAISILVCSRHGFKRNSGWIFTLILCVIRIVGASCQLATYHNHSTGLLRATIIIDSIGLSPLLLATLGMLMRFVDVINVYSHSVFTTKHFRGIQLLVGAGLVLAIIGGTSGRTQPNGTFQVPTTSKIAIILYIIAYGAITLVCLVSFARSGSYVPAVERRVPISVVVALPFIFVRLLHSVLSVTSHSHLFNIATGSMVVRVLMAIVEEFVVVTIYLILGFIVGKISSYKEGATLSGAWTGNMRDNAEAHPLGPLQKG